MEYETESNGAFIAIVGALALLIVCAAVVILGQAGVL